MKQWLKNIFYVPKHAKPNDENIRRLLVPSFFGILLCMVCLAGTTWAWFTASIQTQPQNIKAANYDITVTVKDEKNQAPTKAENGYSLSANTTYSITLVATGTAPSGGYCKIEGGGQTLYTTQISPGGSLIFTLIPEKAADYTFTAVWGTYDGEPEIQNNSVYPPSTEEPEKEPAQAPVPPAAEEAEATDPTGYLEYTVASGDTLSAIAEKYATTVQELLEINRMEDPDKLQVDQKIKIPVADMEPPEQTDTSAEPTKASAPERLPDEAETKSTDETNPDQLNQE